MSPTTCNCRLICFSSIWLNQIHHCHVNIYSPLYFSRAALFSLFIVYVLSILFCFILFIMSRSALDKQPFSITITTLSRCSSPIALIIIWYNTFSYHLFIYINISNNMSWFIDMFLFYVSQQNTSLSGQFFSSLFFKSFSVFRVYCVCFYLAYFVSFSWKWYTLFLIFWFLLCDVNLFSSFFYLLN